MEKRFLFPLVLVLLTVGKVWAWGGAGHIVHADLTLRCLPTEIRDFWTRDQQEELKKVWAESPDSNQAVAEDPRVATRLPPDDLKFLREAGIKTYYQFHHSISKSLCIYLLAKRFREKNPKAAMVYAGILCHSSADPAAFNHGSLIHIYTYSRYKHIKHAFDSSLLDLGYAKKSPLLQKMLQQKLGKFTQKPSGKSLRETLADAYLSRIGAAALLSSLEQKAVSPMPQPIKALADVATYQTHESTRWITDAWAFAASDTMLDLPPSFFKLKQGTAQFCKSEKESAPPRDPAKDSVYDGLFVPTSEPAIGIICEPTAIMDAARLGFRSRFSSACTARTLRKAGQSIRMLNFETLEQEKLSPQTYPVLILHAMVPFPKTRLIRDYLDRGGKLIYIGGRGDAGLTGMGDSFVTRKNEEIPVSSKYGIANEKTWQRMKLIRLADRKVFPLMDNPNTPAGWAKPFCNISIRPARGIHPLFDLDNGTERFCVAAVNPKKNAVWLPFYLLDPFLLTADDHMEDWAHPELDSLGREVILSALTRVSDLSLTRRKTIR